MGLTKDTNDYDIIEKLDTLPNANDGLTPAQLKAKYDEGNNAQQTYNNDTLTEEIDALDTANVKLTGAQEIAGVKTFTSSPIVPTPTTDTQVANKVYIDSGTSTMTNKTLTSPVLNTGVSGTAVDTDDTLAANSDTILPSQKAVKTYVDTEITSVVLGQIPDDSLTTAKMATEQKRGVANGVASLDASGDIPIAQIGEDYLTTAKMATEQKRGSANGVASLDSGGDVPLSQLGNVPETDLTAYGYKRTTQQIYISGWRF